jgi:predicted ester cyclase
MTIAIDPIARNADAIGAYLERHDASKLREDAVFVDVTSGLRWEGREAIAGMLELMYRVAFDARMEEPRLIVGLDGAVLEATFVGRHLGEFAGVPATGREVRVPMVVLYDLADGEICGARVHFGVASFLAQTAGNGMEVAR